MYVREFALFTFCNWELLYFVSIYKGYDTGKRYLVTAVQKSRRNVSSEFNIHGTVHGSMTSSNNQQYAT